LCLFPNPIARATTRPGQTWWRRRAGAAVCGRLGSFRSWSRTWRAPSYRDHQTIREGRLTSHYRLEAPTWARPGPFS
jgi:hypothetical protein